MIKIVLVYSAALRIFAECLREPHFKSSRLKKIHLHSNLERLELTMKEEKIDRYNISKYC